MFHPKVNICYNKKFKHTRDKEDDQWALEDFIALKGLKALGNKLSSLPVTEVTLLPPDEEKERAALDALLALKQDSESVSSDVKEDEEIRDEGIQRQSDEMDAASDIPKSEAKGKSVEDVGVPDEVSKPIELSVDDDDEGQISLF